MNSSIVNLIHRLLLAATGLLFFFPEANARSLFFEDFERLPLGPNVDEAVAGENVWTNLPPEKWSIENDIPGLDDEAVGVKEWEGWAFAKVAWWVEAAEDQRRSEFTNATGTAAIVDPDEWDDKGSPSGLGNLNSTLRLPAISLAGVAANSAILSFDSSWRPDAGQRARIDVSYDSGEPVVLAEWSSDAASPNYKADDS
ncbi:MAG: hypothetical protein AAF514_01165, partial [Verrucomicrobiota bacterium]